MKKEPITQKGYLRKDIEGITVKCVKCFRETTNMWYPVYRDESYEFNCICGKSYVYKVKEIIGSKIIFEVSEKKRKRVNKK